MPLYKVRYKETNAERTSLYFEQSEYELDLALLLLGKEKSSASRVRGRGKKINWESICSACEVLADTATESEFNKSRIEAALKDGVVKGAAKSQLRAIVSAETNEETAIEVATMFPDRDAPSVFATVNASMSQGTLVKAMEGITVFCQTRADASNSLFHWPLTVLRRTFWIIALLPVFHVLVAPFLTYPFMRIYEDMGASLPLSTQIVMSSAVTPLEHRIAALAFSLLILLIAIRLKSSSRIRKMIQDLCLSLPIVGTLSRRELTTQISVLLDLMLGAGVKEQDAVYIASNAFLSDRVRVGLKSVLAILRTGVPIDNALKASEFLDLSFLWLYSAQPEETGQGILQLRTMQRNKLAFGVFGIWMPLVLFFGTFAIVGYYVVGVFMPIMNLSTIV